MRSERAPRVHGDRGTVTAELATCLPVLVLLLAVALSAVSVAGQRVRMQDAAREAARAAARGDDAAARRLAQQYAPGATVSIDRSDGTVTVMAGGSMHLLARWLPSVTVTARAVAAIEPDVDGSDAGYGRAAGVPP